ncbi:MAG: DUF1674 domain-containing protein [Hyphomicrobiaceae bacterium]|nr:DUF1674 domain-containing protein [Hyphomicrobiaceae bacterium]
MNQDNAAKDNAAQDSRSKAVSATEQSPERELTPEARRALAEAEERRRQRDAEREAQARELGGREGPDPVRYGDWENGGIASDF